ncbi:hypothetical protein R69919_02584 [Paraburkholderia gardini]|jgi:hypothetical protein|uniref:Thiamine-binding protein domain-containing protein n=1 Tax=Paraburkholderia gardini TaxID=2823469 RepID=A0ABM8U0H8_9BURK|nr:hypothetical protein R54767_01282 [Paraburkholderia gardini]CAG4899266.1 hypothetical protein R69919_02584 [Paraburkholderia gardini]
MNQPRYPASSAAIAVADAHVTQFPCCIRGPVRTDAGSGATEQEIMEAIRVAAEMRADVPYAHSVLTLETMDVQPILTSRARYTTTSPT